MKFEEMKWCMNTDDECPIGRITSGTNRNKCVVNC